MYHIPILGAIALASGTIIQKVVLRKKKVKVQTYIFSEFLAIVIAMLPFIYFFWEIKPQAYEVSGIAIFYLIIFFSIIANLFNVFAMKWEKVTNLESAKILEPLFVVLLAISFSFIFGEVLFERNLDVIIPAIIAGAALVFSHVKKHHIDFNKYFISQILASFFMALELVISRLILDYYSPITFYFLRCLSIVLITFILFRPKLGTLSNKVRLEIFSLGIIWAIYRIVIYYGYLNFGVIFTTLMIMLGPILVYFFAWKFLKEKIKWRDIVCSFVIIACVLYVALN